MIPIVYDSGSPSPKEYKISSGSRDRFGLNNRSFKSEMGPIQKTIAKNHPEVQQMEELIS